MAFTVDLPTARTACAQSVENFVSAVDGLTEYDLLAPSRCYGWSRLDVIVHVIAGWQEMLQGLVSVVDLAPTVDAASYWTAFADDTATADPVQVLTAQHRRTASYAGPAAVIVHLRDVAAAVLRGVGNVTDRPRYWQGHVFSAGDFLTCWAVENAVHHLDLGTDPAPDSALRLARSTIEHLLTRPLPDTWTHLDAVLVGSGRLRPPSGTHLPPDAFPALG